MRLKKILLLIIICVFCFIPVVAAKDDVVVKSVSLVETTDGIITNSKDEIDVLFNDLEQIAKYKVVLKNNTNKDLYINSFQVTGSSESFVKYGLDDSSREKNIKANSEEEILVSIQTRLEDGAGRNFSDNVSFSFLLNESIKNPETSSNLISIILLVIVSAIAITIVMTKFNNRKGTVVTVIVCFMLLGTSFVFADDTKIVEVLGKITYTSQNYLENSGTVINSGSVDYTNSKELWKYYDKVKNITIKNNIEVPEEDYMKVDISVDKNKRVLAYLVKNGDTSLPYDLHIMSKGIIYAPEDATALFSFPNVETIDGLKNVEFTNTRMMTGMFAGNEKLSTLDISTLNTTNVTDTSYMFYRCYNLGLDESKFDLANVVNKINMFSETKIYNLVEKSQNGSSVKKYTGSGSEGYTNSVYYYTGSVTNNNVKFANFCWKIVRTTETGGVKIIYNGVPAEDGSCSSTGQATTIESSYFNNNSSAADDALYIYPDGTNSLIKGKIDSWYEKYMEAYTGKLEDAIYCNDRSVATSSSTDTYYSPYQRLKTTYNPSLACGEEYQLSVGATDASRKLKYPVSLLSADEVALAGTKWKVANTNYLNIGYTWWTLSPGRFNGTHAYTIRVNEDGSLDYGYAYASRGIRPVVSLNSSTRIVSGDGTYLTPYVIE